LRILAELVNIGTLLAFVIVCAAVLIMRKTHPDAKRPFRAPLGPVVPVLGILCCLVLMFSLPPENWVRLGVWLIIGLVIFSSASPPSAASWRSSRKAGSCTGDIRRAERRG
jgi:APA family basic amino acid/polyamine antiporter